MFTVNNYTDEDEHQCYAMSWEKGCKYIVVGRERGESGTPHLQGFICFADKKSLKQMQEFFPGAHFEEKRGTFKEASDYCKKEGDFFEWGVLPMDSGEKGAAMRELWQAAYDCIAAGDYKSVPIEATPFIKQVEYRLNKEKQQDRNLDILDTIEHEWHYGVPGSGKTHQAYERYPNIYVKDPKERWWDDYKGEDVVLIDDFDIYQKAMAGDMKRWLDKYKFKAPIKGGYMEIRPKKIIVSSNYHFNEIWEDEMTRAAIKRRVKVTFWPFKFGDARWPGNHTPVEETPKKTEIIHVHDVDGSEFDMEIS